MNLEQFSITATLADFLLFLMVWVLIDIKRELQRIRKALEKETREEKKR